MRGNLWWISAIAFGTLIVSGCQQVEVTGRSSGDVFSSTEPFVLDGAAFPTTVMTRQEAMSEYKLSEDDLSEITTGKRQITDVQYRQFHNQIHYVLIGGRITPVVVLSPIRYYVLIPQANMEEDAAFNLSYETPSSAPIEDFHEAHGGPNVEVVADNMPSWTRKLAKEPSSKCDNRKWQSPIRDQGQRQTCVAFAACADLESQLIQFQGVKNERADLSENHAFLLFSHHVKMSPSANFLGVRTQDVLDCLVDECILPEDAWKYDGRSIGDLKKDGELDTIDFLPATAGEARPRDMARIQSMTECVRLPSGANGERDGSWDVRDTLTLERLLEAGHNVVVAVGFAWLEEEAVGDKAVDVIDVTLGETGLPIPFSTGHAMLIVGYNRENPQKPYFIVKNSHGTDTKHDGYLYFSYDFLRAYGRFGYVSSTVTHCGDQPAEE